MKGLGLRKRKLITLGAALIFAFAGTIVYRVQAAGHVELDRTVSITAVEDSNDTSGFAMNYTGEVVINLYKIASLDSAGNPTITSEFASSGADLSILSGNPSVYDVKSKIVEKVENVLSGNDAPAPTYTITANKTENGLSNATASIDGGAGIYLYVPRKTYDDINEYTFTSYIIYAPTSEYIMSGTGSDEWNYDVSFALKAEATPRYGSIKINKTLNTFNSSLGTAGFVFDVEATRNGKNVFSNVYTMSFDSATTQSITVEKIPAGSTVTVTEVYSGASYTIDSSDDNTKTIESLKADSVSEVSFTNDYDNRLIEGGISIENHFVKDTDGNYKYSGNNLSIITENNDSADNENTDSTTGEGGQ